MKFRENQVKSHVDIQKPNQRTWCKKKKASADFVENSNAYLVSCICKLFYVQVTLHRDEFL
jgi:hypothetical protein